MAHVTSNHKILIAMSGGVDSSVCAAIAKETGVLCAGATMKLFGNELLGMPINSTCCSIDDVDDAKSVCKALSIPHYTINCKKEFMTSVIEPFYASYKSGHTPNPCIACNRYLKFDTLIHKARQMDFDMLLTGHYACIENQGKRYYLKRGKDTNKDQSYVLHTLTQEQLSFLDFPLFSLEKHQVREIAERYNLVVAKKKESQDICFIPDGNVKNFLKRFETYNNLNAGSKNSTCGDVVDINGNVLGHHKGISGFTIGQRKGLGISVGRPMYVVGINSKDNKIVVGNKDSLIKHEIIAGNFNWIYPMKKTGSSFRCTCKIRYNMQDIKCKCRVHSSDIVSVHIEDGVSAPALGQSLVLYDKDYVIGGGYIQEIM